jgi:NitT/TauT family transport system permease protein
MSVAGGSLGPVLKPDAGRSDSGSHKVSARRWPTLRLGSTSLLYQVVLIVAFLAIWEAVSVTRLIDPFFISSPSRVLSTMWQMVQQGQIWSDAAVTTNEATRGLALGIVIGVIVGFALGLSPRVGAICMPLLNLLNSLPRVALAPLFILWFGIGEQSKVWLVFTIVVVILIFNTFEGVRTVDRDLVTSARQLGAGRVALVRKIVLPWCLPWIFAGMRIAIAWSLGGAIIGEYIAASSGLGYRISYYAGTLDQTDVFALCGFLLIISAILFWILRMLELRFLRWRPKV